MCSDTSLTNEAHYTGADCSTYETQWASTSSITGLSRTEDYYNTLTKRDTTLSTHSVPTHDSRRPCQTCAKARHCNLHPSSPHTGSATIGPRVSSCNLTNN